MQAKIWNHSRWIKDVNPETIRRNFNDILKKSGFGVISMTEHFFNPVGYTALWLLCESHFAVHTFPEYGKTYIELSSCNKDYYDEFLKLIDGYGKETKI